MVKWKRGDINIQQVGEKAGLISTQSYMVNYYASGTSAHVHRISVG